jgi:hypothetical protein
MRLRRPQCACVNDALGGRTANVALLPVTCPGCAACPGVVHQHMVLMALQDIAAEEEARAPAPWQP